MYFKRMSMHGFKSFAEPVHIDFDRGITCIVGPNGSGKSNISDALRWVLGEQSPKMLRGGKMDEIIFAGTDIRKSRGMAEVNLIIDNSDKSLPIDFSEVSITRRMYRSGESEYLINNSQCRLKDIRELIMDTGIGVDGYSIIGQGKISEIINGKADTRREIFEEAAGIVKYRTKKAETERKLETTKSNLVRVNDIISELEGRVEPLREEAEKAEKFQEISEKYRHNEINVILKNVENTTKDVAIYRKDSEDISLAVEENEQKLNDLDSKIRMNKKRADELDEEDELERERLMNAAYELNELHNSVKIDKEKIVTLKQNCSIFMDEVKSITERIVREETSLKSLNSQGEELSTRYDALQKSERELKDKIKHSTNQDIEKAEEFDSYMNKMYELSMMISSKTAEYQGLEKMLLTLKEREEALKTDKNQDTLADSIKSKLVEAEHTYEEAKLRSEDNEGKIDIYKKNLYQLHKQEDSITQKLDKLKTSLSEENTKKNILEQLEHSYEGYNNAVKFIMKESGIKGIFGTVGDLVDVPPGYEIAIETALGARMQNIICDSDESAKNAVRSLKARKAGRLTFLPLGSMKIFYKREQDLFKDEQGFIGIASDCVKYDPKYKNVIEYLLGNIVIVKNIDDALIISKNNRGFRFVTLEGELINPSGAITGGAYKSNNNAGILERKNRLNSMDKIIFDLNDECKKTARELTRIKDDIVFNEENLVRIEAAFRESELKALGAKKELDNLREKNQEYSDRLIRRKNESLRLSEEIQKTEQILSKTLQDKEAAEIKIADIKQKTEILANERESLKKTISLLSERMTEIKVDSEALKGEKNNLENLIRNADILLQDLNQELTKKEANIKKSISEQESLQFRISGTLQVIETSELKKSNQGDRLSNIKQEKQDLSKEYDILLSEKESLDKTIYNLKSRQYDIQLKLKNGENHIEDWKNKLWEEFEIAFLEALELKDPVFNLNEGMRSSRSMRNELKELGNVNIGAINEYAEVKERFDFLVSQRNDLNEATASLIKIIRETDNLIRSNFKVCFSEISKNFANIFTELFNGGKAEIRMDLNADILEADIDIVVQPPGKKLQNMNLLSGGEKTMTAIALMFAVLKAKPTPFCILDEVEAALDEANIERFAEYLRNLNNIQFVLVTHQKVTMEHANVLFGVTMPEKGVSKVISLKLEDAENMQSEADNDN